MPAVGIDLGTTYSCIAYFDEDDVQFVHDSGETLIPSCVSFSEGQTLVGSRAFRQMDIQPESTVYHFKRMICCDFEDPAVQSKRNLWSYEIVRDGRKPKFLVKLCDVKEVWSPESLTGILLNYLKKLAEAYVNETVTQAVITVPAMFNTAQREVIKTAAEHAGFDVLGLLNEPTAAAIAFGMNLNQSDHTTLVFDLGGGTCDVTIFHYINGELTVKATCGDVQLGGEDFDQTLVQYCVDQISKIYNQDITQDKTAMLQLRKKCERAKKELSNYPQTGIIVTCAAEKIDYTVQIDRKTFEDMNLDKYERAIRLVSQCLKEARLSKEEVNSVLLVGGASRMPKMEIILSNYFGKARINKSMHADESVAHGAAIWAAYLSGRTDAVDRYIGKFHDVTPLSFGIEASNGVMYVIFKRNTHVPQNKTLRLEGAQGHNLHIRMYEGENRLAESNYFLGEARVTVPPFCETPILEITFCLDRNGNISLYTFDKASNKRTDLIIHNTQGRLGRQDIDYLIRNPQGNCPSDEVENQRVNERDKLKLDVYRIMRQARDAFQIKSPELHLIEKHCHSALQWIKNFPNESIKKYKAIRSNLYTVLSPFHLEETKQPSL